MAYVMCQRTQSSFPEIISSDKSLHFLKSKNIFTVLIPEKSNPKKNSDSKEAPKNKTAITPSNHVIHENNKNIQSKKYPRQITTSPINQNTSQNP